jgi:DNA polymerase (family X)
LSEVIGKTATQTVARLLREYAQRTSLRGVNPYRAKAHFTAADSLAALSQPLDRIIPSGTLTEIPGIGYAIADIITKLHQTGSPPSLQKLRKDVPEGVLELFAIPGIRPDKILKLHQCLANKAPGSSVTGERATSLKFCWVNPAVPSGATRIWDHRRSPKA